MKRYTFPVHKDSTGEHVKDVKIVAEDIYKAEAQMLDLIHKKAIYFERPEIEDLAPDLPDGDIWSLYT